MNRWKLISFLLLLPLSMLLVGFSTLHLHAASRATTIVVDTAIDENDGTCFDGDCSLRDAIATALTNDTIIFDNSLSGATIDVSANGKLIVNKDLTISSTVPITISGNNLVRVFETAPSTHVNFFSLTIANGNSTVEDCVHLKALFTCGGGIKVRNNSEVTLTHVVFTNNTARVGGAIYVDRSQLNVHSSAFISNPAGSGSGIFVWESGTAVVLDSTFVGNSAIYGGGAINNGTENPILIQNSLFANNTAASGGALYSVSSEIIVQDSTLRDNSAAEYGGAIFGHKLTIHNSTLSGNVAARGGAIFSDFGGKKTIENSTISGNSAIGTDSVTDGGGAIVMVGSTATLVFTNTTIVSNTAPNVSGRDGLWLKDGSIQIRNSIVAYNGNTNCTIDAGTFDGDNSSIASDSSCANFIVGDPLLGPLEDNGGSTFTHALQAESPAIDSGNNAICPSTDQRGFPRPLDGDGNGLSVCDMGAYEASPPPLTIIKNGPTNVGSGDAITYTLTVVNHLPFTITNVVITDAIPLGANYISGGTQVGQIISWTVPYLASGIMLNQQFVVTTTTTITNSDYRVSASEGYSDTGDLAVVTLIDIPIEGLQAMSNSPTSLGETTILTATVMVGNNISYTWDFGDGFMGSGNVVFHTYLDTGVYMATVTATNSVSTAVVSTQVTITLGNFEIYLPMIIKP